MLPSAFPKLMSFRSRAATAMVADTWDAATADAILVGHAVAIAAGDKF